MVACGHLAFEVDSMFDYLLESLFVTLNIV